MTNLINCEMTGQVDKASIADIVYLEFRKTFDTVSPKILIEKAGKVQSGHAYKEVEKNSLTVPEHSDQGCKAYLGASN